MPFLIVRNDITRMETDAIVNAANPSLLGGGGVDGAIHRAAGPELLAACRKLKGCRTGEAKITRGYRLPARYVIHTVGPVWTDGKRGEEVLLRSCYRNCLELARKKGCRSVAFPMISAGTYGYPKDQAMRVASEEIRQFLENHEMTVYLVVFGRESYIVGTELFREVQAFIGDEYAESRINRPRENLRESLWRWDRPAAEALEREIMFQASESEPDGDTEISFSAARMPRTNWAELLRQTDEGFSQRLLRLIDERGMTDVQCYRKANVDRKLFSKIRSNAAYRPSKPTACAFAIALELPLPEARDLIERAGYSLTHSSQFDIIVEFFLQKGFYDIIQINQVLFEYDLPLLGSAAG